MRYENQNPQYIYLLEKIEEQETKIKELDSHNQFAHQYNKMIVDSLNEISEKLEEFNSLPWYGKMFYQFKL
jgi:hypothetical protein